MKTEPQLSPRTAEALCEGIRKFEQAIINSTDGVPPGPTWTTETLIREFEALRFAAPYVVVRRRSDGKVGSLLFRHEPRLYWGWEESE